MYPKNHLWLSTTARQCSIQRHVVLAAAFACLIASVTLQNPSAALADNWTMSMTVDNQYNVYFGDQFLSSPTFVGGGANWTITDTWNISGVASNAFLYVATASDQQVAQGFIGEFTNTTTSHSFVTSAASGTPWQVFAAGAFLPQLHTIDPSIPSGVWPPSLQPTQTQVQEAVTYATLHSLWLAPDSAPGYTNGANPLPWGTRPGLPANAEWIWHNAGTVPPGPYPVPFNGGNEAEFLVFRIAGAAVPEPSTLCLAGMGLIWSLVLARRRKFGPASLRHRARHVAQRFRSGASGAAAQAEAMCRAWDSSRKARCAVLLGAVLIVCASLTPLKAQIIYQQPPSASTATFAVYDTVPRILADDFPITQTTEVTDLHVFGSWLGDNLPVGGFSDVNFALSLHNDNGLSPGLPMNPPIWQSTAPPTPMAASFVATTSGQGFFDPATSSFIGTTNTIYEYNFTLTTPVTLTPGTYWLDVQAQPGPTANGVLPIFGWDTTLPVNNFGSDAAWGNAPYGSYPPTWTSTGVSAASPGFGLAFAITGKPTPEPSTLALAGMALIGLLGFAHRRASNRRARLNITLGLASFVGFTRKLMKRNAQRVMAVLGIVLTLAWETARKQRLAPLLMSVAIVCASLTPLKAQIIYQQPPSASTATFAVYDTVPRILADDFPITQTTEVTDLHVFGSWLSDSLPAGGFSDVNFALSLHLDNGLSPGLPVNPPIWQSTAPPTPMAASFVATTSGQGFFDPATSSFIGTTNTIYEYNFTLLTPVTLTPGTYWLDVQAQPGPGNTGVIPIFGWDTTLPANNFGSEAAWGNATFGSYPPTWTPTGPNPLGPGFGLAFAITGKPTPEPSTLCLAGMALIGLLGFAHRHASKRGARLNITLGLSSFVGFARKLAKSNARRAVAILGTALALAMTRGAMAVNLVSNGEFSQFTQGHPNEFMADTNTAPDAMLTDWSNNRPFVAIYGPHASELIGATGPSYSGTIWLWGPLNGSNNGFTDTSPNQASDPTANFLAADADPTFFGTGISQTISTPLVTGQQYTLSYYWGAIQDEGDFGPTHSGWTVTLGTQQIVDGNTVFASIPSEGFSGWNLMSTTFTYSGGSTDLLSFLVVGGPSGLPPVALLDSVSLVKASAPEPSTVVLMGLGLLSVVAIKLRRRRSSRG